MIVAKCTLHIGSNYSVGHNVRIFDRDRWNTDGHIDYSRTTKNVILENRDIEKIFAEKFGDAIEKFNEKNFMKHPERLIGFSRREKYESCSPSERREKAVQAYYNAHKDSAKEAIVQFGNTAAYEKMQATLGAEKADAVYVQALTLLYQQWQQQNPAFAIFCAAIHMDEQVPHLHIDYIPVGHSNRGLTAKISMDGALRDMGYNRSKSDTLEDNAYNRWLRDYRAANEAIMQRYWTDITGADVFVLPSEPTHERHKDPSEFRTQQERQLKTVPAAEQISQKSGIIGRVITDKRKIRAAEEIINNADATAAEIIRQKTAEICKESAEAHAIRLQNTAEHREIQQQQAQLQAVADEQAARAARLDEQELKNNVERLENQAERQMIEIEARTQAARILGKKGYVLRNDAIAQMQKTAEKERENGR